MRPLPTAPSADDEISASFMRRLIECIKERTILSAPGYRTKSGPNGTTLDIERVRGVAGVAAPRTPCRFDVTLEIANDEVVVGSRSRTGEVVVGSRSRTEEFENSTVGLGLPTTTNPGLGLPTTTNPGLPTTTSDSQLPICTATFVNLYYDIGGKTYQMGDEDEQPLDSVSKDLTDDDGVPLETAVLALKAKATGDTPTATVEVYASLQELREAQGDDKFYLFPLYMVARSGEGSAATYSVTCDFRTGPILAMGEF